MLWQMLSKGGGTLQKKSNFQNDSLPPCCDILSKSKVLLFSSLPQSCDRILWLCYNKVADSWSRAIVIFKQCQNKVNEVTKVIFVTTRWQTDEEAHFSSSDTFKTRSRQDSVTTRWQTDGEEQFSPFDPFKTRSIQDSVMCRWQTEDEEHFSLLFKFKRYYWIMADCVKKSTFQLQMLCK